MDHDDPQEEPYVRLNYVTPSLLADFVEDLVSKKKVDTYLEALMEFCEEFQVEESAIVSIIPDTIKSKIWKEARARKLLKKTAPDALPFFFDE